MPDCASFFATLEREFLDRRKSAAKAEARMAVFEFIEGWYDPGRRCSALKNPLPIDHERRAVDALEKQDPRPSTEPGELQLHLRHDALGPYGVGKTHVAIGLWLAACRKGVKTRFATAAAIVHELTKARDERRLLRKQRQFAGHDLLIIDELGFVPLSKTGAELLSKLIGQRSERGATIVTLNLPFDEWTATFVEKRLTGAFLDRLTHLVHILERNGRSYRLVQSCKKTGR